MRRRSWWGWGWTDAHPQAAALDGLAQLVADRFGGDPPTPRPVPRPPEVALRASRVAPPDALAALASGDPEDRLRHGHGNAYRDVVRASRGEVPTPPDLVLRPADAGDVARILNWCADAGIACVPFGGGTSVVGGVTPPDEPTVSLDLEPLGRVTEVDRVSGAAHIQAGALGPAIEDQLRPHQLTLRHFPQSWEFSTLGGWIATRAGGHFATGRTHIDDLVEAVSAVTPVGTWTARRLPASGAGPSPDRMLLGSEGTLGVITDAWVRVQPRATFRAQATASFDDFSAGVGAVRALARSGLEPANCRLLDPIEATLAGAGDPARRAAVLVLGFESADHPLGPWIDRAIELVADHGGTVTDGPTLRQGDATGAADGDAGAWRSAFLRAPYLRDGLVRLGTIAETFETATTWDRFEDTVATLTETARAAATDVCGAALVGCRLTHAYPDGAAPYLTVIAPGRPGEEVAMWDQIKAAVSDAIDHAGATITHHHAIGRDHRPWYERQRPEPFAVALRAAKHALDPAGILNPGVLV